MEDCIGMEPALARFDEQLPWADTRAVEDVTFDGTCRLLEQNVDYLPQGPGDGDYPLNHIPDPGMCCAMCHGIPECQAWVWKDGHLQDCPYQCWILVNAPQQRIQAQKVVSGVPPSRPLLRLSSSTFDPRTATPPVAAQETEPRANCAVYGSNCWQQRCCKDPSQRCYMKDPQWAGCRETCTPGINPSDPMEVRTAWTCTDVNKDLPNDHVAQLSPFAIPTERLSLPPPPKPYVPLPPLAPEATAPGRGRGPGAIAGTLMFCMSLSQPDGYELQMLKAQYEMSTSIFACEGFTVYSNRAFEVVPGVATSVVLDSLKCDFHEIAWNTGTFIAVWHKVVQQGWYKSYDWTVKVDPDATFFPDRLRAILPAHAGTGYLVNCKYGMHGPIEVLAKHALDTLAQDYARSPDGTRPQKCVETYPQAITGKAQWGEDMWLDYCLRKVLGVTYQTEYRLMCEAHCDCPNWYWCHNGTDRVTYHPFKREDMYRQCMANAMSP